ncbi:Transglycosylase SLT domain protein [uncultured Clostridium sp.]
MADNTIDTLDLQIKSDATKAAKQLDVLANKLENLGDSFDKLSGSSIGNYSKSMKEFSSSLSGLKNIKVSGLSKELAELNKLNFSGIKKNLAPIKEIASALKELDGLQNISIPKIDTKNIKSVIGVFKNLQDVDTSKIKPLTDGIKKIADSMSILNSVDFKDAKINYVLGSLKRLVEVDTGKFDANGISDIVKSISGLSNLPDISSSVNRFLSSLQKLANAGSKTGETASELPKLGNSLKKVINDISKVGNVSESVNLFVQSIGRLASAGDKTGKTASQLNFLAKELIEFFNVMKNAPEVSKNTLEMTQALAQLSSSGNGLNGLASKVSGAFGKITSNGRKTFGTVKKLSGGFKGLFRQMLPFFGVYKIFDFGKEAINVASDLKEVQNVVNVTFGKMKSKIEDLSSTSIEDFGMSELTVKQISSRFQAMGTAMGFPQKQMSDMSVELTKLAADMSSFYNVEQSEVARSLQSVFTGETEPLRKYGLDLTQATLAEWAMKNGLDANVQSMSQAEKTMLRYQYVLANTTAAQGDFARTSDTWANQVRILKQSFQQLASIIGGSLINAFKPLVKTLNSVLKKVISFAETVSNALGKIFGWKIEVDAGGMTNDLGDISSGIGDIESNSGGAADNIGQAAENMKKLRDYTLGIDELNVISPDDTPTSGGGGGTGGGGGSGTGGAVGSGGGVNLVPTETIFEDYKSQIDSLYELGDYISTVLTEIMQNIPWDDIYEEARNFGKGLADFLNGLIKPGLFYELGGTLAKAINTALQAENAFAINFDWKNLGKSLAKSLKGFFVNWDAKLSAKTLSNFASGFLKAATSAIKTMMSDDLFEDVGERLVEFICGIDWGGLAWDLKEFFDALAEAMIDFPADFAIGIVEAIIEEITGQEVEIETPKWLEDLKENMVSFFRPVWGLLTPSDDFINQIKEKAEKSEEPFKTFSERTQETLGNMWKKIKEFFAPAVDFFDTTFTEAYEKVRSAFKFIGSWFGERWADIKKVFEPVATWFSTKFETAYNFVKTAFKFIGSWFGERWADIKKVFEPAEKFFSGAFEKAYDAVTRIWDGISGYFRGIANKIIAPIGSAVNGVIDGINWVLGKVGAGKPLSRWSVPQFASGTNGLQKNTVGMVNDQKGPTYKEMIVPPKGKPFIPKGRNVVLPMQKGTKIMPADQTKEFLKHMPHFKSGIGDFFGNAWSAIKNFTGNVMDYLQNPGDILKIAIDKFTDMDGIFEPFLSIAKGSINLIFDSAKNYIKGFFDKVVPKVNYNPSGGVEQWRSLASHALKLAGQYSDSNLNLLLYQMQTESGGNPRAINNWDSNAKKGTPSKGLMQVIDPTFRAYAQAPYNKDVYDPLSNMLAAIRYTISRYGSLSKGWKGHGYALGIGKITMSDLLGGVHYMADGGVLNQGELFFARENGPELVARAGKKSMVMNNNQIVESVSNGVYRANEEQNRLLATLIRQNQQILEYQEKLLRKENTVDLDGNRVNKLMSKAKSNAGFNFSPA